MSDRQWEQAAEAFDALQWTCKQAALVLGDVASHEHPIDEEDGSCFDMASDELDDIFEKIIDIRNKCYDARENQG